MDDISNRTLALMLLAAIVVSLGATVYTLNYFNQVSGVTGRAASPKSGNVTLTVETAESFQLKISAIDFGAGFVNTSVAACTDNATLFAAQQYNDTNGDNCWTSLNGLNEVPKGFQLENDGNVNLSIYVQGPNSTRFFRKNGVAPPAQANLSWKGRSNETGSCASGLTSTWKDFQLHTQLVCDDFLYYPTNTDSIGVDVKVVIPPSGLSAGLYENASITFTGAQS